ncbi:MAG: hypothetical protein AAB110_08770 [Candidatus Desantisbacteria bacterium]
MKTDLSQSKIALKPYLEIIKNHCEQLSNEELADVILRLAQEVPVGKRVSFLNKIESCLPGSPSIKKTDLNLREELLNNIAALKEEIEERIASIEDGSYGDDNWDDRDYNEDPEYITDDQISELDQFFLEVESFFLEDQLKTAREIYQHLFQIFNELEGIENSFSAKSSIDIREARARYCRSVYETSNGKQQIDEFFEAMNIHAPMSHYDLNLSKESYPLMQDVIEAKRGDLKSWDSFLPAWKKALMGCHTDRAEVLLMEAVNWLEGIEGVARLARNWKATQPRGYLFWIQSVAEKGDWTGILAIAQEALEALPKNGFRVQVSQYLIQAAQELGEEKLILHGKRERFFSSDKEQNLLGLLDEAIRQNLRTNELENALEFLQGHKRPENAGNELYVKVLLMSGKLIEAFCEGKKEEAVGWSYGKAGIVFGSTLFVLTNYSKQAVTITKLLQQYAENRYPWDYPSAQNQEISTTVYKEILKGLEQFSPTESEKNEFLDWAAKIGCDRINHIVSNKHRAAYSKAAEILGALAECYLLLGDRNKAANILRDFYDIKFKHYRAFRDEVKQVVNSSELLKGLYL